MYLHMCICEAVSWPSIIMRMAVWEQQSNTGVLLSQSVFAFASIMFEACILHHPCHSLLYQVTMKVLGHSKQHPCECKERAQSL